MSVSTRKRTANATRSRTSFIDRLPAELHGYIADDIAIDMALRWRAVCRRTYSEVSGSLRRSLLRVLFPFFRYPSTFLTLLTKHAAVIGGVAALAFILRDRSLKCNVLQVYTPHRTYLGFLDNLRTCYANSCDIRAIETDASPPAFAIEREICASATFHMRNNHAVIIYRSASITPLTGIVRGISSAVMNFVTEHSFGCSFPGLCMRRQALLCDRRLPQFSDTDFLVMNTLLRAGFHFAVSPFAWPERRVGWNIKELVPPATHPCLRLSHVCPNQGRFFGDPGSLVALLDPLGHEVFEARRRGVPPFGPMIAWRLLTSFECTNTCTIDDPVLRDWFISMPVLVMPSPLPSLPSMPLQPGYEMPSTPEPLPLLPAPRRRRRARSI